MTPELQPQITASYFLNVTAVFSVVNSYMYVQNGLHIANLTFSFHYNVRTTRPYYFSSPCRHRISRKKKNEQIVIQCFLSSLIFLQVILLLHYFCFHKLTKWLTTIHSKSSFPSLPSELYCTHYKVSKMELYQVF